MINFLIVVIILAAGGFLFLCVKIAEINDEINKMLKSNKVWLITEETKPIKPVTYKITCDFHAVEDTAGNNKLGRHTDVLA
jgi:hypothetical protein